MKKIYIKVFTLLFMLALNSVLSAQWDTLNTGTNSDLYAVQFVNSSTGWIAGAGGIIKKSVDGGSSWISQSSKTLQTLRRIIMIDANTGFICGDSGKILKTTNSGTNWNNTNTSSNIANIYAMDFIDASTGICANETRTQFKTTNGGTNWTSSTMSGVSSLLSIYGIDMTDSNTVYVSTGSGFLTSAKVYKSVNSGTNYIASLNDAANFSSTTINDVKFINSSTGYAGASNNNLARTTDGGTTWVVKSFPKGINQISFPDSDNLYICGEDLFKAKSDNNGANWTIDYNYNTAVTIYGISFINSTTGWICGSDGVLFKTTSGGGIPPSCNIINSSWVNTNVNVTTCNESIVDDCGNIYTTGYTGSPDTNIITQKYSSSGYLYWSKTYNGSGNGNDGGVKIKLDNDGNVFVAGYATGSTTGKDFVLIKYLSDGQREWVKTYDTLNQIEESVDMTIDNSGNVLIAGTYYAPEDIRKVKILKYNTNGDLQWTRERWYDYDNYPVGIVCNNSDAVFMAGVFTVYGGFMNNYSYGVLYKFNSSGTELWEEYIEEAYFRNLVIGNNGNLYVSGSEGNSSFSLRDIVTIKYNTSGVMQWIRYLEGGLLRNDYPTAMRISNGGQLVVTGYIQSPEIFIPDSPIFTFSYNSNGDLQWYQRYQHPIYKGQYPRDLSIDTSGSLYITGRCRISFSNLHDDIFTMKYNSTGTSLNINFYGAEDFNETGNSVNADNAGNVFVTGTSFSPFPHSTILKYAPSDFSDKTLNLTAMIQGFYDSTANSMVSDTMKVFLRNSASPFTIVDSCKSVLSSAGTGTYIFNNVNNGNYYIVLNHRNSIETWSSVAQTIIPGAQNYNFTGSASTAFGNNQAITDASPVRYSIYSGDINQDGIANLSDVLLAYNDANSFVTGYNVSDITGNNITDLNDVILAYNNSNMFVSKITP